MCLRICNHVNPVYPLLNPLQQGFRPNRSCVSRLIQHVNFLALSRDNGGKIYIIYLDMAKAFDGVPHQKLLFKLRYYGFRDPLLSWEQTDAIVLLETSYIGCPTGCPDWPYSLSHLHQ